MKLGYLLDYVSTGQMIRVVILDEEYEEVKEIEFENDPKDFGYKANKNLFVKEVQSISSTTDDYLRVEVCE